MAAEEELNPLKLPDDSPADRWLTRACVIITALGLAILVLVLLDPVLRRPGCTMEFPTRPPATQPK
jgi:hypothetical protein